MNANRFLIASVIILLLGIGSFVSPSRAQETFELIIPEGTTLCEVGKNGAMRAQIDLVSGTIELRTDVGTFESELVEEFRVGAPDNIATATGPGVFKRRMFSGGSFTFEFNQRFSQGDNVFDLTLFTDTFHQGDPPAVFDEERLVWGDGLAVYALRDRTSFMEFGPCHLPIPPFAWDVYFEGNRRVQIALDIIQRNFCGAWVTIPSTRLDLPDLSAGTIEQSDYWKLSTWSYCHYFKPGGIRILLDQSIGEVHGIDIDSYGIDSATLEYLDADYHPIQSFRFVSETYEDASPIYLNEAMVDNRTSHQDESGDFDPWIEIYNPHEYFVDLGGAGLTRELENPSQWIIPEGTFILGKGFLVVWADGEPEEGPLHASFRLEPASGEIGLSHSSFLGEVEWDSIRYGPQSPDRSIGRLPDGEGEVVDLPFSSPGASNSGPPPSSTATNTPTPVPTFANERSDIDGSGGVDAADLLILLADWMKATDAS